MISFPQFITSIKHYCDEQIMDDEMGGVYSTHGRDDKCIENFNWKE
jgi:hypothetical protein